MFVHGKEVDITNWKFNMQKRFSTYFRHKWPILWFKISRLHIRSLEHSLCLLMWAQVTLNWKTRKSLKMNTSNVLKWHHQYFLYSLLDTLTPWHQCLSFHCINMILWPKSLWTVECNYLLICICISVFRSNKNKNKFLKIIYFLSLQTVLKNS